MDNIEGLGGGVGERRANAHRANVMEAFGVWRLACGMRRRGLAAIAATHMPAIKIKILC